MGVLGQVTPRSVPHVGFRILPDRPEAPLREGFAVLLPKELGGQYQIKTLEADGAICETHFLAQALGQEGGEPDFLPCSSPLLPQVMLIFSAI